MPQVYTGTSTLTRLNYQELEIGSTNFKTEPNRRHLSVIVVVTNIEACYVEILCCAVVICRVGLGHPDIICHIT